MFALGGEDDLVRLLARVTALQAFVETGEGTNLLAGYKRAANILKKEEWDLPRRDGDARRAGHSADRRGRPAEHGRGAGDRPGGRRNGRGQRSHVRCLAEEAALDEALERAEPLAAVAIEAEDFTAAMAALASLRAPIDAFFDKVTVNDPDADIRARRLNLLARFRDAVHRVADFSQIEG